MKRLNWLLHVFAFFAPLAVPFVLLPASPAQAEDRPAYVRLPLQDYNRLNDAARDPKKNRANLLCPMH